MMVVLIYLIQQIFICDFLIGVRPDPEKYFQHISEESGSLGTEELDSWYNPLRLA